MFTLDRRQSWALAAALAALMGLTRSHHFATLNFLPDASWAVFFLAGFLFSRLGVLLVLLAVAGLADALALGLGGVADFCVSIAYPFLVPAYGALWFGGRWLAKQGRSDWRLLPRAAWAVVLAALACESISSGSFYFLSGVVAAPSLAGFGATLELYFPRSLANFTIYLALAAPPLAGLIWAQNQRAEVRSARVS